LSETGLCPPTASKCVENNARRLANLRLKQGIGVTVVPLVKT
jgi:hypothetical protein